jgi:hypothetical protein
MTKKFKVDQKVKATQLLPYVKTLREAGIVPNIGRYPEQGETGVIVPCPENMIDGDSLAFVKLDLDGNVWCFSESEVSGEAMEESQGYQAGMKVTVKTDASDHVMYAHGLCAPDRRPPNPGEVCTVLELSCSCGVCSGTGPRVIMDDGCTWMTPKDSLTVIEEPSTETEMF